MTVDEPVGKAWVGDDRPPARAGEELAVRAHLEAGRGLHPAIDRENPEGRDEGAERDHAGRREVQLAPHLVDAEQHDAEEAGFEEEGGQHLIGHQGSDHRPGLVREDRPVGAELVGHDDPGHDAHRKGDGEDFQPVAVEVGINAFAGFQPQRLQHHQEAGQTDRESRKDEVKADGERKLQPRQQQGVERLEHRKLSPPPPPDEPVGRYTLGKASHRRAGTRRLRARQSTIVVRR